jgi:hypothetical protein
MLPGNPTISICFPNFAFYYRHRVEPVVRDVIAIAKVRRTLAGDAGDLELARAIALLDRSGASEGVRSDG